MTPELLDRLLADPRLTPRVPVATYRLQFQPALRFADACALIPYLAALGVSDIYASSYLAAQPGSTHGYDIVNHNALNPELGTEAEYRALVAGLQAQGMGQILDVVPNHMGIAGGANPWWNDVLENGPGSLYAEFFDIDWDPVKPQLANKVLLPILGDPYGYALENQQLCLEFGEGTFRLRYGDTRLPLAPQSIVQLLLYRQEALTGILGEDDPALQEYQSILTALGNLPPRTEQAPERVRERIREKEVIRRRLATLVESTPAIRDSLQETVRTYNGKRGDPRSFDLLERLLNDQAYRLAYWRVAAEEINYRRFFDVNDLAAIRMENPAVFRETHRFILRLVEEGCLTGLRLDHPDGLFDPPVYFASLQRERLAQVARALLRERPERLAEEAEAHLPELLDRVQAACEQDPGRESCRPLYLLAEKILARGERLPTGWAVHGTTGYEFLNLVGGLFVDATSEKAVSAAYASFTGERTAFADLAYASKKLILEVTMSSELNVLAHALDRLGERNRYARDFTLNSLTHALREVIANFPVYRTYITGREAEVSLQDRACVEVAVAFAKRRNPTTTASIFEYVRDVLLLRIPENADESYRQDQRIFVHKFQQLTAPVTAKGVEDTAFYRYNRLVSLNEVGGDPERFGLAVADFHQRCLARQEKWPAGLSATTTHDTKRSEDVRARIHVLSEMPGEWRAGVARWHRWNRRHTGQVEGRSAPDRNDEYLFYQTLVGVWPPRPPSAEERATLTGRLQHYMQKATKEAKRNTSWINPNEAYDRAVASFVARVLDPREAGRFLADFAAFCGPIASLGMWNSLAQTLLKITAPGVPDFYQGSELWDLRLVDPDNRRPVDFTARAALLQTLRERIAAGDLGSLVRELLAEWPDGRVKLYTIHRALAVRRGAPDLFQAGAYIPLATEGGAADHVCAFARRCGERLALSVVPRLLAPLTQGGTHSPLGPDIWGDTAVRLPDEIPPGPFTDAFTGRRLTGPRLPMADLLAEFPVALLFTGQNEG